MLVFLSMMLQDVVKLSLHHQLISHLWASFDAKFGHKDQGFIQVKNKTKKGLFPFVNFSNNWKLNVSRVMKHKIPWEEWDYWFQFSFVWVWIL